MIGGMNPSPGADVGAVSPSPGADVAGVSPSPGADVQAAAYAPVPWNGMIGSLPGSKSICDANNHTNSIGEMRFWRGDPALRKTLLMPLTTATDAGPSLVRPAPV